MTTCCTNSLGPAAFVAEARPRRSGVVAGHAAHSLAYARCKTTAAEAAVVCAAASGCTAPPSLNGRTRAGNGYCTAVVLPPRYARTPACPCGAMWPLKRPARAAAVVAEKHRPSAVSWAMTTMVAAGATGTSHCREGSMTWPPSQSWTYVPKDAWASRAVGHQCRRQAGDYARSKARARWTAWHVRHGRRVYRGACAH